MEREYGLIIDCIKENLVKAYFDAKKSYDLRVVEKQNERTTVSAFAYLNKAVAHMTTAQALYQTSEGLGTNEDVECIIEKFFTYQHEFFVNYETDHSDQWTDIEFENYQSAVKSFLPEV